MTVLACSLLVPFATALLLGSARWVVISILAALLMLFPTLLFILLLAGGAALHLLKPR
jgi:hypothetical protein